MALFLLFNIYEKINKYLGLIFTQENIKLFASLTPRSTYREPPNKYNYLLVSLKNEIGLKMICFISASGMVTKSKIGVLWF